jgi:U3 small nucleolar RNA-associated protein 20
MNLAIDNFFCVYRDQITIFVDAPDQLRPYYSKLLSHSSKIVRDFAAKSFSIITRKLKPLVMKSHFSKLLTSLSASDISQLSSLTVRACETELPSEYYQAVPKKIIYSMDGLGFLFFYTLKGIKGRMHSKAGSILKVILNGLSNLKSSSPDDSVSKRNPEVRSFVCEGIVSVMVPKLFRHLQPMHMLDLWTNLIDTTRKLLTDCQALQATNILSDKNTVGAFYRSIASMVEVIIYGLTHASGRGRKDAEINRYLAKQLPSLCLDLYEIGSASHDDGHSLPLRQERVMELFHLVWITYPNSSIINQQACNLISSLVTSVDDNSYPYATRIVQSLIKALPSSTTSEFLLPYAFSAIEQNHESIVHLRLLIDIFYCIYDTRDVISYKRQSSSNMKVEDENDGHDDEEEWMYEENYSDEDSDEGNDYVDKPSSHSYQDTSTMESLLSHSKISISKVAQLVSSASLTAFSVGKKSSSLRQLSDDDFLKIRLHITTLAWLLQTQFSELLINDQIASSWRSFIEKFDRYVSSCSILDPSSRETFIALPMMQLACMMKLKLEVGDAAESIGKYLAILAALLIQTPLSISLSFTCLALVQVYNTHIADSSEGETFAWDKVLSSQQSDELLIAVSDGLCTPSYYLRYNLVMMLTYFPAPQMINVNEKDEAKFIEVAQMCLEAINLEPSIETERDFARTMLTLEVLIRNHRLPAVWCKAVCSLCLGIFHIKFKPFWDAATALIIAAFQAYENDEDNTWTLLWKNINLMESLPINSDPTSTLSLQSMDTNLIVENLRSADIGSQPFETACVGTSLFYYHYPTTMMEEESTILVKPDSRTDVQTVYLSLWNILKRCPQITLKKSKILVPIFFQFLSKQYYRCYHEDVDYPLLVKIGIVTEASQVDDGAYIFPAAVLKKRLLMQLQVFAEVSSPKQLFEHKLLYQFYLLLLARPELEIVKLAVQCALAYKPGYLVPYKDSILRILNEKTFRDELLSFDLSPKTSSIEKSHRLDLIPIISRLVYGRLVASSKQSRTIKDQTLARRSAILSFLSPLSPDELSHFINWMIRGLIPPSKVISVDLNLNPTVLEKRWKSQSGVESLTITAYYQSFYELQGSIQDLLQAEDMKSIPWERQIGFLYLLESMVKIIGHGLSMHMPRLINMLTSILHHAHILKQNQENDDQNDDDDDDDDDDINSEAAADKNQDKSRDSREASRIRTMCIQRIAEIVHQYHGKLDLNLTSQIFDPLAPLIALLPQSISHGRAPALLKLIDAYLCYDHTIAIIASKSFICETLVRCIGSVCYDAEVNLMLISAMFRMLGHEDGRVIISHAQLIVEAFSKRFLGSSYTKLLEEDDQGLKEIKLSDLNISTTNSIKQELELLYHISDKIFNERSMAKLSISKLSTKNLATLLLGMLRCYTLTKKIRIEEDWVVNILQIYRRIVLAIDDLSMHVPFISRLFGPASHASSHFNSLRVRTVLLEVYASVANHPSTNQLLLPCLQTMRNLTAQETTTLDSRNYDKCVPVFQRLAGDSMARRLTDSHRHSDESYSWNQLLGPMRCTSNYSLCSVVIFECFRCFYDKELIIRTAAASALKHLLHELVTWITSSSDSNDLEIESNRASDLISSILIPYTRSGIRYATDDTNKRGFVQLLAQMVEILSPISDKLRQNLDFHADLSFLLHDDPEQNFFENISHIQLHRRVRAMSKLRGLLESADGENIRQSSLIHVMLPLAYQYLLTDEFSKKDHLTLINEAAGLMGSICKILSWSQYYLVVKTLLRKLDHCHDEKESALVQALCHALDAFHFEMTKPILPSTADLVVKDAEDVEADEATDEDLIDDDDEEAPVNEEEIAETIVKDPGIVLMGEEEQEDQEQEQEQATVMAKTLHRSILPWVKVYLLKDSVDQKGEKCKVVRPHIAVAMAKIVNKLEPPIVISSAERDGIFRNLVMTIINTLRSRDVAVRDTARTCLAKIIMTAGLESLPMVLHELASVLVEGYQRHICCYSMRFILTQVLKDYSPPIDAPSISIDQMEDSGKMDELKSARAHGILDDCLPAVMHTIVDDIVGLTQEDRDVDSAHRSLIREAKGIKAYDVLELCARMITFRPTYALLNLDQPATVSSIHAMSIPLINLLTRHAESKSIINRIAEALQRLAIGLSLNPSISAEEMLIYLHATLHPFVIKIVKENERHKQAMGLISKQGAVAGTNDQQDDEDDMLDSLPSYLKDEDSDEEEQALYSQKKKSKGISIKDQKPSTWLPFELQHLKDQRAVIEARNQENRALHKVQDGASAPKLTGNARHDLSGSKKRSRASGNDVMDAATIEAVKFCLTLFHLAIKKNILTEEDPSTCKMIPTFLPLLGHCLRLPGSSDVVALAMKCLCSILPWNEIAIDPNFARSVASQMLKLMFRGGIMVSSDNELVQACIKGLTSLFQNYNRVKKQRPNEKILLPLPEPKLRTLLQLLVSSILEVTSNYQNAAFQLIRSVFETRTLVPEVYDLVKTLMDQLVLSQRKGVRDLASSSIVYFVMNYPLGDKRFANHMNQLIGNCSYQFAEGRLAALSTLLSLVKVLPTTPVLHDQAQVIFLPMALRLVNDDSSACRALIADVLIALFRRLDTGISSTLVDYTMKWFSSELIGQSQEVMSSKYALIRTGAQLLSIILTAKPELVKRISISQILIILRNDLLLLLIVDGHLSSNAKLPSESSQDQVSSHLLEGDGNGGGVEVWAVIYYLLSLLENLFKHFSSATERGIFELSPPSKLVVDYLHSHHGIVYDNDWSYSLMELLQESMLYPHVWIRSVASRALNLSLSRRDPMSLVSSSQAIYGKVVAMEERDYLLRANALYQLARKLCIVLNQPYLVDGLLESTTQGLLFIIRAMYHNPDRSSSPAIDQHADDEDERDPARDDGADSDDGTEAEVDDDDEEVEASTPNADEDLPVASGASWVMQRLRNIGSDKRGLRRFYAIRVFQAVINAEDERFANDHLKHLVEICVRNEMTFTGPNADELKQVKDASSELASLLEKKVGSVKFVGAYSEIQRHLHSRRAAKKRMFATSAVIDPKEFTLQKVSDGIIACS